MMRRLVLAMWLAWPGVLAAQTVAEPDGYRGAPYRGAVPATLAGATVIDVAQAYSLWETQAARFVDVLPRPPKPENLPADTVWREETRLSIPGAIWLPNVGYQELAPETLRYFEVGLAAAGAEEKDTPLVFFCLNNCWMSWNAAKRAVHELGYVQVYWFPEGTDGWTAAGFPTIALDPFALN
ncbi:PQQ-dependent catabolism-associated CXXCW motif protein [Loktanella sp. S4079]|uniref:PQQ-dependent catabolism-associated CXXCW motif protein n=1 Tax=Loktanella sp. S4079 TaxID=579483 RepID=UPI000A89E9A4